MPQPRPRHAFMTTCLLFVAALMILPCGPVHAATYQEIIPPGPSRLYAPHALAFAPDGTLYYNDYYTDSIVSVAPDGTRGTLLSMPLVTGQDGYSGTPYGDIAVGPNGDIYALVSYGQTVVRFAPDGTMVDTWGGFGGGAGQFTYGPYGVAISPAGEVYVADQVPVGAEDTLTSRVQVFGLDGSFVRQWYGMPGRPHALAFGADGKVYLNDGSGIDRFSSAGALEQSFEFPANHDRMPALNYGLLVADDGTLYVGGSTDSEESALTQCGIHHLQADGTYVETLGRCGTGEGQYRTPYYLAWGPDNVIAISDVNARITQMSTAGNVLQAWGSAGAEDSQFYLPSDIALAADGSFFVADTANHRVKHYDARGNVLNQWAIEGMDADNDSPNAVDVGPDGTVWILNTLQFEVQQFSADGTLLQSWGAHSANGGQFSYPMDLAVTDQGMVLVADMSKESVLVFQSDGTYVDHLDTTTPKVIDLTADGDLVVGSESGTITVYDDEGGAIEQWDTGTPIMGLALTADDTVFASLHDGVKVVRYSSTGEVMEEVGAQGYEDDDFQGPMGLAAADGTLFVVDQAMCRIALFKYNEKSGANVPALMLLLQ